MDPWTCTIRSFSSESQLSSSSWWLVTLTRLIKSTVRYSFLQQWTRLEVNKNIEVEYERAQKAVLVQRRKENRSGIIIKGPERVTLKRPLTNRSSQVILICTQLKGIQIRIFVYSINIIINFHLQTNFLQLALYTAVYFIREIIRSSKKKSSKGFIVEGRINLCMQCSSYTSTWEEVACKSTKEESCSFEVFTRKERERDGIWKGISLVEGIDESCVYTRRFTFSLSCMWSRLECPQCYTFVR